MKTVIKLLSILIVLVLVNCKYEDFDDNVKLTEVIKKNDELFELIQKVVKDSDDPLKAVVCIDFVYPFQLLVINENYQIINQIQMNGDDMFSNFLSTLPSNNYISISFPLKTTLANGEVFIVNNNSELKIAIDACSKEDIIGECNGIFGNPNGTCVWNVPFIEGANNEYAGAVFTANTNGTINFHHLDNDYTGTWVFLYINNELNLNIFISGISDVVTYWNHNYKITTLLDSELVFNINNNQRTLTKTCEETETYNIGETGPKGGIIAYKKQNFSNGWQHIEVATSALINQEWGCIENEVINAQYNQIGSGKQNNFAIVNSHNNLVNYYINPQICSNANNGSLTSKTVINFSQNDAKDWFIPSKKELEEIYNNLNPLNLGNFVNTNYWTSTEASISKAYAINLQSGIVSEIDKNSLQTKTIVVRYF